MGINWAWCDIVKLAILKFTHGAYLKITINYKQNTLCASSKTINYLKSSIGL